MVAENNQGAMGIAKNPIQQARTKHNHYVYEALH